MLTAGVLPGRYGLAEQLQQQLFREAPLLRGCAGAVDQLYELYKSMLPVCKEMCISIMSLGFTSSSKKLRSSVCSRCTSQNNELLLERHRKKGADGGNLADWRGGWYCLSCHAGFNSMSLVKPVIRLMRQPGVVRAPYYPWRQPNVHVSRLFDLIIVY
jgi:hypothetical protein